MSFFVVIFKVIPYLMPFIKEMLIGKKSWKQAFKENRGKTILGIVVTASLIANLILVVKVGSMAFNYLELSRAKQELEKKYQVVLAGKGVESTAKHPLGNNNSEVVTEVKNKPPRVAKSDTAVKPEPDAAAEIKAEFERMRQREAAEH
jgi:hypothetical protein